MYPFFFPLVKPIIDSLGQLFFFFLLFYAHTKSLSYAIQTGPRTSVRFVFFTVLIKFLFDQHNNSSIYHVRF
jgi:hypothetical protein